MTHKQKDILVDKLVDKSEALRKRVDFLESQNYESEINRLNETIEGLGQSITSLSEGLTDSEFVISELLKDIVELYKRLDRKNEDIEILNLLINKGN